MSKEGLSFGVANVYFYGVIIGVSVTTGLKNEKHSSIRFHNSLLAPVTDGSKGF